MWVDQNAPDDFARQRAAELQDSVYVKVIGNIRAFGTKRSIIGVDISPIQDFNQLAYHQLDVIYVHLYNTRGGYNQVAYQQDDQQAQPVAQDYQQPQQQYASAGLNDLQQAVCFLFVCLFFLYSFLALPNHC